jgi:hypothetical protein
MRIEKRNVSDPFGSHFGSQNEERYMGDSVASCARPTNRRVTSADFLAANESTERKVA